jgi:hypothetical protein
MPTSSKFKSRTKIQFTDVCFGSSTKYVRLEEASAAAEKYSRDRGYQCQACWCEKCKRFHVRQRQAPPGSIPDEERWTPAKHRRAPCSYPKGIMKKKRQGIAAAGAARPPRARALRVIPSSTSLISAGVKSYRS